MLTYKDNNLNLKLDNNSVYSNIKTYYTKLAMLITVHRSGK